MEDIATLVRPAPRSGRRQHRPAFVQRYWAFLSYSHQDEAVAAWLQSQLEGFKVPKRLVGRGTPYGIIPARLSPVFRDRHELAAGHNLRDDISAALAASRFLVVLCSPAGATSRWVDEEIRLFKQLRPDGEVLAAIIGGEPWASEIAGREAEECFPPALKVEVDEEGRLTDERAEPMAADLREGRDGRQTGLLKIIAGMLDVGLDELVQRESHRRQRRMMAITGASLVGMAAAVTLAVTAIQARDAARDQRREAEGLIGFMLGDLKDRLEPIGRLDVLDSVGARALAFYEKQDQGSLSDEGLAQRSRALTLMGQIATSRGDLDGALRRYAAAMAGTAELARREPDNPSRLYDHAQNVFWVGDAALKRGQVAVAERHMREYKALAERMVALDPGNEIYRQERKYADTNLGVMLYEQDRAPDALRLFGEAVAGSELLLAGAPANGDFQVGLSEALAWLADGQLRAGRLTEAIATRRRQLDFLAPLAARVNSDADLRRQQSVAYHRLGTLLVHQGKVPEGVAAIRSAVRISDGLRQQEGGSAISLGNAAAQQLDLASALLLSGATAEAAAATEAGCALAEQLHQRDRKIFLWRVDFRSNCLINRARLASAGGNAAGAESFAAQAAALTGTEQAAAAPAIWRTSYTRALAIHGVMLAAAGRSNEALDRLQTAARQVPPQSANLQYAAVALRAARASGESVAATRLEARLRAAGYSDPWLARDLRVLASVTRR